MQTYKREDDEEYGDEDYDEEVGEDLYRDIESFTVTAEKKRVELPEKDMIQEIYEMTLSRIVELLEDLNNDLMSFIWKPEMLRLYNILMAFTVNDTKKTKTVCGHLGRGFNRLANGPHDSYFIDLGIPEGWYNSQYAEYVKPSDFKEQEKEFTEADDRLKYQWFIELEIDDSSQNFFTYAQGYHVALIDISAI